MAVQRKPAAKSTTVYERSFALRKSTPNKQVFEEDIEGESAVVGSLYVLKKYAGAHKRVRVTLEFED